MSNIEKRIKIKDIEEYNQKFKSLKEDFVDIFINEDYEKNPFKELLESAKEYKLDYNLYKLEEVYKKIDEDNLDDLDFIDELVDELKYFYAYVQENIKKEEIELSNLETLNKDENLWTHDDMESFEELQESLAMYEDLRHYCNGIVVK